MRSRHITSYLTNFLLNYYTDADYINSKLIVIDFRGSSKHTSNEEMKKKKERKEEEPIK